MTKNRRLAISIMESVAEKLGDETIFDCNEEMNNDKWYQFEELIVDIIEKYYPDTIKEIEV